MGQQTSSVTSASDFDPTQARLTGADGGTPIATEIIYGQDDHGCDLKLFGATSGKYMMWDESADKLILYGQLDVGVDDTGHDAKFFGATSGSYMLWDEDKDRLDLIKAKVRIGTGAGATNGVELDGTDPDQLLQAHAYIDGAVASGAYAGAYFTNTVTASQTNNVSVFGTWSELYLTGDVSLISNHAAIWGNLEMADAGGTLTLPGGVAWHSAITGTIISPDGLTVSSGGLLACFVADNQMTSGYTSTGATVAGYAVRMGSGKARLPYGLWIDPDSVYQAIRIGELSSDTPGSGLVLDSTYNVGIQIHVDDNELPLGSATTARGIDSRFLNYNSPKSETWGIQGKCKISALARTANVAAGVVGAFESTGTCSTATGSGNTFVTGVMGRLGLASGFTIGSGTYACGVLSFYNTLAANDPSGEYTVAYMATASDIAGVGDWDYGLYVEDTAIGVYLSSPTTGISIASATGYAIDIQTTGQFRMGIQGTGIPTATDTPHAVEIHAETNADAIIDNPGGTWCGFSAGIRCRYEISKAQTATVGFQAIEGRLRPKAAMAGGVHCGISGTIEADGAVAFTGTATTQRNAGNFCIELGEGCSFGSTSGWLTGVTIDSSIHATQTGMTNITYPALRIKKSDSKLAWQHGIYIDADSCTTGITIGTATTGMSIGAGCTSALQIGAAATTAGSGVTVNAAAPVGFYFDDGGSALTAWSECFTVGLVLPTASTGGTQTGMPSATHIYIDQQANYTGPAGNQQAITALWAGYLVRNTSTLDGFDQGGAHAIQASVDVATGCEVADGTTLAGIQFSGNWSLGTITGYIVPIHIPVTNANWSAFMKIDEANCYQDTAAGSGGYKYLKVYLGDTLYTIVMATA